jgi:hypothetical protein
MVGYPQAASIDAVSAPVCGMWRRKNVSVGPSVVAADAVEEGAVVTGVVEVVMVEPREAGCSKAARAARRRV